MTHAELVERAERWLRKSRGCQVVVTRGCMMALEQPDALGFNASGFTTLVECKASRGDFLRDQHKWHRRGVGMGNRRYYLTPAGLVKPEEVPEGWGLLHAAGKIIRVVKDVESRPDRNWIEEMRHLLAQFRRPVATPEPFPFVA